MEGVQDVHRHAKLPGVRRRKRFVLTIHLLPPVIQAVQPWYQQYGLKPPGDSFPEEFSILEPRLHERLAHAIARQLSPGSLDPPHRKTYHKTDPSVAPVNATGAARSHVPGTC